MDYIEIVGALNNELYDRFGETELNFIYSTNGFIDWIMFGEIYIWDSETDGREWIEESNDHEPFIPYIKKELRRITEKQQSLLLY